MRERLAEIIALHRADGGHGPIPTSSLPAHWMRILRLARSWSVVPWSITNETPTPDVVARWVRRGIVMQALDGG